MHDWIQYSLALAYGVGAVWFVLATLHGQDGAAPSPSPVLALLAAAIWPLSLLAVAAVVLWTRPGRLGAGNRSPLRH